jgi:hypothetical protein
MTQDFDPQQALASAILSRLNRDDDEGNNDRDAHWRHETTPSTPVAETASNDAERHTDAWAAAPGRPWRGLTSEQESNR